MSVITRANALALQGYRHCCHVMLHCPVEEKLFGFYPVKHAVLVSKLLYNLAGFPCSPIKEIRNVLSALLSFISTREFLRTREKCREARVEGCLCDVTVCNC